MPLSFEDSSVVVEELGVRLLNDTGCPQHTEYVIDASAVVLDGSELVVLELAVQVSGSVFALRADVVEGLIASGAAVSLGQNQFEVVVGDFVGDLLVG